MINLTPAALEEARRRAAAAGAAPILRVALNDGGCAGRKYDLGFGSEVGADDVVREQEGLTIACRAADRAELAGLEIDFVDALMDGGFRYENPNAGNTCGCGKSFKPLQTL